MQCSNSFCICVFFSGKENIDGELQPADKAQTQQKPVEQGRIVKGGMGSSLHVSIIPKRELFQKFPFWFFKLSALCRQLERRSFSLRLIHGSSNLPGERKTPQALRACGVFLELLGRFELPTSSLPRVEELRSSGAALPTNSKRLKSLEFLFSAENTYCSALSIRTVP